MSRRRGRLEHRKVKGSAGSCRTGKVRYASSWEAERTLDVIMRRDDQGHTEERAYGCDQCGGWHLTSTGLRK